MKHGGKRPGAGRPKSPRGGEYESAEAYLEAVVLGIEEPHAIRVAAARCLIQYQAPRRRAKAGNATQKDLKHLERLTADNAANAAWEEKSKAIRAKHGRVK